MTRIVSYREFPSKTPRKTRKPGKRITKWIETQPRICPVCCVDNSEEVHHIIPKGMGGNRKAEHPANWLYICRRCHEGFHRGWIPKACIFRAKKAVGGFDHEMLEEISGHPLMRLVEVNISEIV